MLDEIMSNLKKPSFYISVMAVIFIVHVLGRFLNKHLVGFGNKQEAPPPDSGC